MKWFACLFLLLCFFTSSSLNGFNNNTSFIIDSIIITGNKKTKTKIILRQLAFKIGDEIAFVDTAKIIELSNSRLQNTSLFNTTKISFKPSKFNTEKLIAKIEVSERWYLFPTPYFNIADRNFNTWWRQYNFNLRRVDFGAQLKHYNLTGRNDVLDLVAYGGFSENFKIEYRLPQLGKKQIYGFETEVYYRRIRSTLVNSINNQQVFYPATVPDIFEEATQQKLRASAIASRQKNAHIKQHFGIRYQNHKISTQIQTLENTPDYFPNNKTQFQYFSLFANIQFDYRNLSAYATKGWHFKAEFEQDGLGLLNTAQQTKAVFNATYYYSFNKRISTLSNLKVQLSHQNQPNYFLTKAMGYSSNDVRGYERFVIDGQHFLLQRNALRYQLFNFNIKPPLLYKIKQIQNVPITILPKIYFEHGKVWDKHFSTQNPLTNQWLYGYGVGIDVVTFYDLVASIEYSINKQKAGSFVLQFNYSY